MKKTRIVALLLILTMCIVPVFAQGGSEGSKADSPKLVYWTMWNEAEPQGTVIAEAVAAYSKKTGVPVEVVFNGRDIRKTLQPALDAGETIDMFDEDIERVLNVWGNYLLPLDSYVEKSYSTTNGKAYKDVVSSTLLNLVKSLGNGSIKNIPYQPSMFVTMYNKDLFQKAGITAVPKTWAEFEAACDKLLKIGVTPLTVDDAYMAALFGYTLSRVAGMDKTLQMAATNNFNDPTVLQVAQIFENMAKKGYISKKAASNIYPAGQVEEIATGKVAMYLNGTWLPNEIKGNAPNMSWGAFAWPAIVAGAAGTESNNYGAQSFGINKNTKYPQEAFDLVVWLTTGEWDATLAADSLGVPVGNDSAWPVQLAEAKAVLDTTTVRMPWAVGMEDNPEINAKIKENLAKLIQGSINAQGFYNGMNK